MFYNNVEKKTISLLTVIQFQAFKSLNGKLCFFNYACNAQRTGHKKAILSIYITAHTVVANGEYLCMGHLNVTQIVSQLIKRAEQ